MDIPPTMKASKWTVDGSIVEEWMVDLRRMIRQPIDTSLGKEEHFEITGVALVAAGKAWVHLVSKR